MPTDSWSFPKEPAFAPIAAFLAGEDPTSWPAVGGQMTVSAPAGLGARAWGYNARAYIYVWDLQDNYGALEVANLAGRTIAAGPVTLSGLANGTYNIEVWDTRGAGAKLATIAASSAGGSLTFTAPLVDRDAAYKVVSTAVVGPVIDVYDSASRTVAAGSLGSADTGGAWTIGGTAADYAVNSGELVLVGSASGATRRAWLSATRWQEQDVHAKVQTDKAPASAPQTVYLMLRAQDLESNYYRVTVVFLVNLTISIALEKVIAGVSSVITSAVVPGRDTFAPGAEFWIRAQAQGVSPTTLRGKVWIASSSEPSGWDVVGSDG